MRWSWLARCALCVAAVAAQNNSTSAQSSPSVSLSATTSSVTITTTSRNGDQNTVLTTVVPTTFNVTYTPSRTASSASATSSSSASASATPIVLETKLDPAFGVLGAILILTGLPSAFWGHKNRWYVYPILITGPILIITSCEGPRFF